MKPPSSVDTLKIINRKKILQSIQGDASDLSTLLTTDEDITELGKILSESNNSLSTVNLSKIGNLKLEALMPALGKNTRVEMVDLSHNNIAMHILCHKRKDFEPFILKHSDLINTSMTSEKIADKAYQQMISVLRLSLPANFDKNTAEKIAKEKNELKLRLKPEAFLLFESIEKMIKGMRSNAIVEVITDTKDIAFHIETPIQQSPIINDLAFWLAQNTTLKILKLNDNYLTDLDVSVLLIALEYNATLTEVHLLNNRISAEGRKKIAEFQNNPKHKTKCIIKLDAEQPKKIIVDEVATPSAQKKMRSDTGAALTPFHLSALESLSSFPEFSSFPDLSGSISDPFDITGLPSFPNSAISSGLPEFPNVDTLGSLSGSSGSSSLGSSTWSKVPHFSNPLSLEGFGSLDEAVLPALEPDFSTWGTSAGASSGDATLADGNCAFNAVTLGICHLLKNDQIKMNAEFLTLIAEKFPTEVKQFGEVTAWIKQEQDTSKLQKLLSPLFRNLAVVYIQKNYAQFAETYEQGLKGAFTQYACLGEQDETYCVHPHIIAKFEDLKKQQDDLMQNCKSEVERQRVALQLESTLIAWWKAGDTNAKEQNEGMRQYFANIQKSAEGASDLRTWGSEVEIDAIAKFLGITIKNKKMGGKTQILGCGYGIVNNLSQEEVLHLDALSIGSVFARNFRVETHCTTLHGILRQQRLSEVEVKFLDEAGRKEILDFKNHKKNPSRPMPSQHFLAAICGKLEKIGVLIYRNVSASGVSLMDFVAPKRLAHLIKPIPEALIQKVLGAYKNDIPSFEIMHLGAHWIYTPASEASKSAAVGSATQSATTAAAALPAASTASTANATSAKRKFGL